MPGSSGASLVRWFRAARTGLYSDLVEAEAGSGRGVDSEAQIRPDIDDLVRRFPHIAKTWPQFEEQLAAFPWGAQLVFLTQGGELEVLGRASSYHVLKDGSIWRASALAKVNSPDDVASCTAVVDFLHAALEGSSPLYGHIEWDDFGELTNLDVVLSRKRRTSLCEGRQFLRGYAWVTVCPAELVARLGGVAALEDSGAFHRVLPLRAGGVLLQASATMDGYTDQVMERIFETLAPVLPPGEPRPDPAHPDMRFVPRDAATVR
ncbi:hypothetical protein ACICHK_41095 [Streptomyces sp. AHU1]|uniref:hypothetical protein n=1 Tax=Streptomyces sp. AHU1 TaxID=3377215 RepID=UPI0038780897